MRKGLGHFVFMCLGDIVPQYDITEGKEGRGTIGKMRNDHAVWDSAMLVQDDQIRNLVATASRNKFRDHMISSIYSLRVGKDEPHLLGKLLQTTAWVSGRGDENFWIFNSSHRIFIVHLAY